ncbi:Sel1 repeat-containing protein [Cardiosporidium cionae]|uniref:Sel1 repeat-containing protein n=1 Tax=Cardiosporidium cionae TaxID=476202 RepID=A0ABQ7JGF7_9APIC|nr:Sel1 repeat-containing protein [Cardiosporidium cionae]|eukprot:KAF8823102.1 Sel1 repeat-containing protein [Cardiosporidium cionae]
MFLQCFFGWIRKIIPNEENTRTPGNEATLTKRSFADIPRMEHLVYSKLRLTLRIGISALTCLLFCDINLADNLKIKRVHGNITSPSQLENEKVTIKSFSTKSNHKYINERSQQFNFKSATAILSQLHREILLQRQSFVSPDYERFVYDEAEMVLSLLAETQSGQCSFEPEHPLGILFPHFMLVEESERILGEETVDYLIDNLKFEKVSQTFTTFRKYQSPTPASKGESTFLYSYEFVYKIDLEKIKAYFEYTKRKKNWILVKMMNLFQELEFLMNNLDRSDYPREQFVIAAESIVLPDDSIEITPFKNEKILKTYTIQSEIKRIRALLRAYCKIIEASFNPKLSKPLISSRNLEGISHLSQLSKINDQEKFDHAEGIIRLVRTLPTNFNTKSHKKFPKQSNNLYINMESYDDFSVSPDIFDTDIDQAGNFYIEEYDEEFEKFNVEEGAEAEFDSDTEDEDFAEHFHEDSVDENNQAEESNLSSKSMSLKNLVFHPAGVFETLRKIAQSESSIATDFLYIRNNLFTVVFYNVISPTSSFSMLEDFLNLKDSERISKTKKGKNKDLTETGKTRQGELRRKKTTRHAKWSLEQRGKFTFCIPPLCEQLKALSKEDLSQLKAETMGALAYLFLFGVPDSKGILNFPGGWPRNIDLAMLAIKIGLQMENCSMCYALSATYFIIGFLFAIGFPPFVNYTKGIKISEQAPYSSFSLYFEDNNSYRAENIFTSQWRAYSRQIERNDHVMMAYTLASRKQNFIGQLALSYYLNNGIGSRSLTLKEQELYFSGSQHREGHNGSEICLYAIVPLIEVASKSLTENKIKSTAGLFLRSKSFKDKKTKEYINFVQALARSHDRSGLAALGRLHYIGYEAGGINRNVQRAAELWEEASLHGDGRAALTRAMLYIEDQYGTAAEADYYLRQAVLNGDPITSALANFQLYKLGHSIPINRKLADQLRLEFKRSMIFLIRKLDCFAQNCSNYLIFKFSPCAEQCFYPCFLGDYLKTAADLGDSNAQILLGHAYVGHDVGVILDGGSNVTKAKYYYELAAAKNRLVAKYNLGMLNIQEAIPFGQFSAKQCIVSYNHFLPVAHSHPDVSALIWHSLRAHELGDSTGALLRSMLLSELGHPVGHDNAAYLWSKQEMRNQLLLSMIKEQQGLMREGILKKRNGGKTNGLKEDYLSKFAQVKKMATRYMINGLSNSSNQNTKDTNFHGEKHSSPVETLPVSRVVESEQRKKKFNISPTSTQALTKHEKSPELWQKSEKQAEESYSLHIEIQSHSFTIDESIESTHKKKVLDKTMPFAAGHKYKRGSHMQTSRLLWILRWFPSLSRIVNHAFSYIHSLESRLGHYGWVPSYLTRQTSELPTLAENAFPRLPQADYIKPKVFSTIYSDQLLEHLRVSEFLNCWALPEFYFNIIEWQQLRIAKSSFYEIENLKPEKRELGKLTSLQSAQYPGVKPSPYATFANSNYATKDFTEKDLDVLLAEFSKNPSNPVQACSFYYSRRFASQGDWPAMFDMYWTYLNGRGGTLLNATKAFEWIERAAKLGNIQALYQEALMLEDGIGIAPNKKKAYEIYWDMVLNSTRPQSVVASLSLLYSSTRWCFMKLYRRFCATHEFPYLSSHDFIEGSIKPLPHPRINSSKSLVAPILGRSCIAKDSMRSLNLGKVKMSLLPNNDYYYRLNSLKSGLKAIEKNIALSYENILCMYPTLSLNGSKNTSLYGLSSDAYGIQIVL